MSKDRNLKVLARINRKNPTVAERRIWRMLRDRQLGLKFKRQFQIGKYITDFACPELKLIVECDGGQHDEAKQKDDTRTEFLSSLGYKVIRIWNNEIFKNQEGVWLFIRAAVDERLKQAYPLSAAGESK